MKVLIIGHNVISSTNNMGKTLHTYFADFSQEEIAEFYIQDRVPHEDAIGTNFYRRTDRDALREILPFGKKKAHVLRPVTAGAAGDGLTGVTESIRQYGRRRSAFVYIARNLVWDMTNWKSREFKQWIREFNPDLVFFMSGDYGFMYKIALFAADYLHKPLVVACVDDYYIYNRNGDSPVGKLQHAAFMKKVRKTMDRASCIFAISDSMAEAYAKLFNKPCLTLHTSAKSRDLAFGEGRKNVAYFGNLGFKRYEQIAAIGRAIKKAAVPGTDHLDVYSGEQNPVHLADLTQENGVHFHGAIPAEEVLSEMAKCMAVVHTESFDQHNRELTRYSVSTKIAESLLYGPCLIAYGPDDVASIDYLKKNKAAYVITKPEDLESGLKQILSDEKLREEIVTRARALAAQNHDEAVNSRKVREWLQMAIDGTM